MFGERQPVVDSHPCRRVFVVSAPIANARLTGKTTLLRPCRWRHGLTSLQMVLGRVLRRLVVDGLFERLYLLPMFLGRVAGGSLLVLRCGRVRFSHRVRS